MAPQPKMHETVVSIINTPAYSVDSSLDAADLKSLPLSWWQAISDKALDSYVREYVSANFELVEARERVLQAEERVKQVRAGRLPRVSADVSASRIRSSDFLGNFDWSDGYSVGLGTALDTDIFGGLRSAERAARLSAEAARLNYLSREQQGVANFIRGWVAAASLQRQLELALAIAESFETTYNLTNERYRAGSSTASAADVQIARQNLVAARADIPSIERQLNAQLLLLDQQLAQLPGTLAKSFNSELILNKEMIAPIGLPADLLRNRPDVAAAELAYRAALEDIGAARANLLPGLSLSASLSFQNDEITDIFDADEYLAGLIGSLTQPVFQGGRLRSQLRVEESEARELATAFARTSLNAFSEVETALVQQAGLIRELEQLEESLETAILSDRIAQDRYRQGLQSLLTVLETQRSLNSVRFSILITEQSLLESRINLYLSLGGTWFEPETSFPETTKTQ